MSDVLVLIPARYDSSRFLGKPLAPILGKSMIQRVYENMLQTGYAVAVVTDDQRIYDHVVSFQGVVHMVEDCVATGTERVALAFARFYRGEGKDWGKKIIINVQGDEPLLQAQEVRELGRRHHQEQWEIGTMVRKQQGEESVAAYGDPHVVKVAFTEKTGVCHYFSRSPVPHQEGWMTGSVGVWYQHVGVYSFTAQALDSFMQAEKSYLESCEKLEQLRALEVGLSLKALITTGVSMGVDRPSDIAKIEGVLRV